MKELVKRITENKVFRTIKPWLTVLGLFLILRYSGVLAGVSFVTNSALMKTGVMDASTETIAETEFDYNFSVRDMNGKVVPFSSFKGKTVFLNAWATWCGPCRHEMPSIQSLYDKVDKNKVVFVMLAIDSRESPEKVNKFLTDNSYSFPTYQPHGELPELLQVRSIPTTFVINANGKLVARKEGAANYDTPKYKEFLEDGK